MTYWTVISPGDEVEICFSVSTFLISTNSSFLISLSGSSEKDQDRNIGCDTWLGIGRLGTFTCAIGTSVLEDGSGASNTVLCTKEMSASDHADGMLSSDHLTVRENE